MNDDLLRENHRLKDLLATLFIVCQALGADLREATEEIRRSAESMAGAAEIIARLRAERGQDRRG